MPYLLMRESLIPPLVCCFGLLRLLCVLRVEVNFVSLKVVRYMDVVSIISNALSGIIASLTVLLLVNLGKQIRTRAKQRRVQPREVLDERLRQSQDYKDILQRRKTYRFQGYLALVGFIALMTVPIMSLVLYGTIEFHFKSVWDGISAIGLYVTLACLTPMSLYYGYARITAQEVEAKRGARRARAMKEAHGARPYGYIGQGIIFPVLTWFFLTFLSGALSLVLIFPPPPLHISLALAISAAAILLVNAIYITQQQIRWVHRAIKDMKQVPEMRKTELRNQFIENELKP